MRGRILVPAASLVAAAALLPSPAAARVTVQPGVEYGSARVDAPVAGSAPLLLDLYRPARRSRRARPVVIVIHGGGFAAQSRRDPSIVRVARGLASKGVVAASIDYRLLGQEPVPSRRVAPLVSALAPGPFYSTVASAVDDTLTAVRYLKAHSRKLRIDTGRLGLVGSSAGAITADHVGYVLDDHGIRGPRVRFVASLWGGILAPPPGKPTGSAGAVQLDRGEASLFAVHGDDDPTVPVRWDDELVARARAQHVRHEYHRIPGGRHGYGGSRFFTRRVAGSRTAFQRLLRFATAELRRR